MSERLEPVRGVQAIRRGVYEVDHAGATWAVAVDFLDLSEKVHLYRDGQRVETQKSPATFAVEDGGSIEAQMGLLGMRRLAFVRDRCVSPLRPAEGTLEAWRAAVERRHPTSSKVVGILSLVLLVIGLLLEIPQLLALTVNVTGVAPPVELPSAATMAIGVLVLAALLDRALRFQHNRWLD